MDERDIRWKHRFDQFVHVLELLEQSIQRSELSVLERAGLIQFFELAFELSWKLMKDYLAFQGIWDLKGPRDVLKQAYEAGLLKEGHGWLDALADRNLTTHIYREEIAERVERLIRERYFPLLLELKSTFDDLS